MNAERLLKVLLSPHVSEKSSYAAEGGRQYVFKVLRNANKREVRQAIEMIFNVEVASVRSCVMKGKKTRFGRIAGVKKDWKKVYVTLKEGSEIEMHDGQG